MRCTRIGYLMCGLVAALASMTCGWSQTRDEKVRGDRDLLLDDAAWHYDDFAAARATARREGKPLMAVLRCIP